MTAFVAGGQCCQDNCRFGPEIRSEDCCSWNYICAGQRNVVTVCWGISPSFTKQKTWRQIWSFSSEMLDKGSIFFLQQAQILSTIPHIFRSLLLDECCVVHQVALQTFSQFAEQTTHESVVSESISASTKLQDTVVDFINQVPHHWCSFWKLPPRQFCW